MTYIRKILATTKRNVWHIEGPHRFSDTLCGQWLATETEVRHTTPNGQQRTCRGCRERLERVNDER